MKELYEAIEAKIKASGYPRAISGEDVYNDICDQIDGKENGSYVLLSKFEDDVIFEYHITIQDEDFNLGILTMRTPEGVFETDFDEDLQALGDYVKTLSNVQKFEVLPYHTMGEFKWRELGWDYPLTGVKPPTSERVANANSLLHTEDYKKYLERVNK